MNDIAPNIGRALRAIDAVWEEMSKCAFVARELGKKIDRLPDISEVNARRRATLAVDLLERLNSIDTASLPGDLALTVAIAKDRASVWAREADWYWLAFDPLGVGYFALFAPTAYAGGFLLNFIDQLFRGFVFEERGDLDRYLGLVADYARLVDQMRARTAGQAERGIHIPRPQLAQSITLMKRVRDGAGEVLTVARERLGAFPRDDFAVEVDRRVADVVLPAFDALIAELENPEYRDAATEGVGLGKYAGGAEIYAELVRLHTTLDLTPEQVHERGIERMARVQTGMRALFDANGFDGEPAAYLATIEADPAWRAIGAEAVGAVFRRYIDRIAPHIDRYFNFKPKAGHDAAPLPDALSGSMTFGYYSPPNPSQEKGLYIFNAANLSNNALPNIAALNYHELVPGHHFHLASQRENDALHPLRQHSFISAYNEGWAEYAATLAGEMGMYEEPEEKFGRLMMDAFLTCRLVVDTGMNALGWSLEDARTYMREHSFMPETEIGSESLRYSCDIPGQSLAYKLGDDFIMDARETMRVSLGDRFDIRDFHDAVLRPGAQPLPLLARHVEAETERLLQASEADA